MHTKELVLHKLGFNIGNDRPHADPLLQSYGEINQQAGEKSEMSLQYIMQARKLRSAERYSEALDTLDKALKTCEGEAQVILEVEGIIRGIAAEVEVFAMENLSDIRIGPLYENLLKRGNVSFYLHVFAMLHFQTIGETEKAAVLSVKLKKIAPNFKLLKQKAG